MNQGTITKNQELKAILGQAGRIDFKSLERSPKLAEIRAVYKSRTKISGRKKTGGPSDVVEYLREIWNPATLELVEECILLCLNSSLQVLGWVKVSSGGFAASHVDPRLVFSVALQAASSAVVLAHNHPSGSLTPSEEDLKLTLRLSQAGAVLGVHLLDHLIITKDEHFSFSDHGLI